MAVGETGCLSPGLRRHGAVFQMGSGVPLQRVRVRCGLCSDRAPVVTVGGLGRREAGQDFISIFEAPIREVEEWHCSRLGGVQRHRL